METESKNPLVLVAEDHPINQVLVGRMLTQCGYTFHLVGNGAEAVSAFETLKPDLILMDVQMPVLDGLEATIQIRELEKANGGHVPIVAVTARALVGDAAKCLESGMDDYISKPLRFQVLSEKVTLWLPKAKAA